MSNKRKRGRPANDPGPLGWYGPALSLILSDYGWTHQELAEEVSVSAAVVSTWVAWPAGGDGSRPPSRYQARLVASALDAPRRAFGSLEQAITFLGDLAEIDGGER